MIEIFKSIFGTKKKNECVSDSPGRTFNKMLVGKYFGCEDTDGSRVSEEKKRKIEQITELELVPMFTRYSYEAGESHSDLEVSSVYVVFQKEVLHNKMIRVTEVSFIVYRSDFDEFEKMSGLSLSDDFRELSSEANADVPKREERRLKNRD